MLPEIRVVFGAAGVECIFRRGHGLFVEEIEFFPDVRVGERINRGVPLSVCSPGVGGRGKRSGNACSIAAIESELLRPLSRLNLPV